MVRNQQSINSSKWKITFVMTSIFVVFFCSVEERSVASKYLFPEVFVSSLKMDSYSLKTLNGGSKMTKKKKKSSFRDKTIFEYKTTSAHGDKISVEDKKSMMPSFAKKIDVSEISSDRNNNRQKEKGSSSSILWMVSTTSGRFTNQPSVGILQRLLSRFENLKGSLPEVQKVDLAIFATYAFSIVVNTIPTICVPLMAADPAMTSSSASAAATNSGAFSANVASLCTLGGALGKFLNGFVCQKFGGRDCVTTYLVVISILSMFLSKTSQNHGWIIAGLEFTQSIMWTACTVLLFNIYEDNPKKLATAITTLSLTSSSFVLLTKILGMSILQYAHWRTLVKIGSFLALSGAAVMFTFGEDQQKQQHSRLRLTVDKFQSKQNDDDSDNFISSLKNVLGNKLFWFVGLSHATVYLARGMDKILGSFYQEAAQLPAHIGSGMTSTVTIGFVYGLISGRKMQYFSSVEKKKLFLFSRYKKAIFCALFLAGCANKSVSSVLGASITAFMIAIASGAMAANVSYQFFQIPAMVAKKFGKDKAVCISFLDGMAYLFTAPIWAVTGKIISCKQFGSHGWSVTWGLFAALLLIGGKLMSNILSSILNE